MCAMVLSGRFDEVVPCPRCHGFGCPATTAGKQDPPCQLCHGHGKIPRHGRCICGRPALVISEGVLWCGTDKKCIEAKSKPEDVSVEVEDWMTRYRGESYDGWTM